jgi:hypothetical protein
MRGVTLKELQELLGHSSLAMTSGMPTSPRSTSARLLAAWRASPAAGRQGRRRLEHAGRPVPPHAGDRGGQEQVDVPHEAQRPVWGGGGHEDDVAGDRRRLLASIHHVLRWQIGRVGFNRRRGPVAWGLPPDVRGDREAPLSAWRRHLPSPGSGRGDLTDDPLARLAIPASGAGQFAPAATSNYLD